MTRLAHGWGEQGDDPCHGCGIDYALELEARCVACDRGTCAACVLLVRGELWCAECAGESTPGSAAEQLAARGRATGRPVTAERDAEQGR